MQEANSVAGYAEGEAFVLHGDVLHGDQYVMLSGIPHLIDLTGLRRENPLLAAIKKSKEPRLAQK